MGKNYDQFNKFCKKYDMHSDGIEEEVVEFLKGKFPKAYKGAKKDLMEANDGNEEEMPSPGSIFAQIDDSDDEIFYSSVEGWFKKNYPDDELN